MHLVNGRNLWWRLDAHPLYLDRSIPSWTSKKGFPSWSSVSNHQCYTLNICVNLIFYCRSYIIKVNFLLFGVWRKVSFGKILFFFIFATSKMLFTRLCQGKSVLFVLQNLWVCQTLFCILIIVPELTERYVSVTSFFECISMIID